MRKKHSQEKSASFSENKLAPDFIISGNRSDKKKQIYRLD